MDDIRIILPIKLLASCSITLSEGVPFRATGETPATVFRALSSTPVKVVSKCTIYATKKDEGCFCLD